MCDDVLPSVKVLEQAFRTLGNDGVETESSFEQAKVEAAVGELFEEWKDQVQDYGAETELNRNEHCMYLLQGLQRLPGGYCSLDASRPWLAYWILHSLDLLGMLPKLPEIVIGNAIQFLARCQDPEGGFGGGPGQQPHLAPTYAAVNALCILASRNNTAYKVVNRQKLFNFLMRCKRGPSGPFAVCKGGEVDTRGTYTALSVASICHIITPELTQGVAEWVATCQTYEGGIGGEPGNEAHGGYAFCGLAALVILNRTDLIDLDALLKWAATKQMSFEGGFQGRTNKLVDGCYSFWVGGLFPLLDYLMVQRNEPGEISTPSSETVEPAGQKNDEKSEEPEEANTETKEQPQPQEQQEEHNKPTAKTISLPEGWLFDQWSLQKYVLVCCQGAGFNCSRHADRGGLRDKPGLNKAGRLVRPDYYHTCYCISGLSIAQNTLTEQAGWVLGRPDNRLRPTNALYNIGADHLPKAMTYFSLEPEISVSGVL